MVQCATSVWARLSWLLLVLHASAAAATAKEAPEAPAGPAAPAPAFGLGAQTEFRSPLGGVPSLVIGWEGGSYQLEGSFGLDVTTRAAPAVPDVYDIGLRLYLPVHRSVSADFSLLLGGGLTVLDPPQQDAELVSGVLVGARVRIFVTPNAAITAMLGGGALVRKDSTRFGVGALPMGGAGFVYYFR